MDQPARTNRSIVNSQPQHHHLSAKKSCLKKPKALEWQSKQTKNDDTTKAHHDHVNICCDDHIPSILVATMTNQRKKVSFRGRALQRRTIALSEFSPDEFLNYWYTAKELNEIQRQLFLLVRIRRARQDYFSSTTLTTRRIEVTGT